jgi:hypothetical protein
MKPSIPLRTRWRAELSSWPTERRGRFEQRLNARRLAAPAEPSDWAFVDTYRVFRAELLASGEISFAEAYDGAVGEVRLPGPGDADWPEYEQKLNAVLKKGRQRPALANGAQLRLIETGDSPGRWDP